MTRIALFAVAASMALPAVAMAEPVQLYMDPNHTQIKATWKHFSGVPLDIRFTEYDATVMYDADDASASSVEITLPVAGLESGVPPFNDHLKSADFFEAETYPTATFTSTSIESTGEDTATMTGDLTIKDVTAPVTFDVTLIGASPNPMSGAQLWSFSATTTLDRTEWGLGNFAPAVPADVVLTINSELGDTAPAQ
jgi:polyisoprenoid-binding protein YceI